VRGEEGKGAEGGREFVLCPRKKTEKSAPRPIWPAVYGRTRPAAAGPWRLSCDGPSQDAVTALQRQPPGSRSVCGGRAWPDDRASNHLAVTALYTARP